MDMAIRAERVAWVNETHREKAGLGADWVQKRENLRCLLVRNRGNTRPHELHDLLEQRDVTYPDIRESGNLAVERRKNSALKIFR